MNNKFMSVVMILTPILLGSCTPVENITSLDSSNITNTQPNNTQTGNNTNNGGAGPDTNHTYPIPETNNDLSLFNSYYRNVDITKTGRALRDEIHDVISSRKKTTYDELWTIYRKTDIDHRGKINDIYSNTSSFTPGRDQAGSYQREGDVYNREHCIPKSWWGGSKSNQGADPFIVQPSDGYVNNRRSNYSFGEVNPYNITYSSNNRYSLLGTSKYNFGPRTVFEINDEYKGDMARMTFYAVTCYDPSSWTKSVDSNFDPNGKVFLTDYAVKLFMKWHLQDPVSDWERKRNNLVQKETRNRNPYIDHPEWACAIWGTEHFGN